MDIVNNLFRTIFDLVSDSMKSISEDKIKYLYLTGCTINY